MSRRRNRQQEREQLSERASEASDAVPSDDDGIDDRVVAGTVSGNRLQERGAESARDKGEWDHDRDRGNAKSARSGRSRQDGQASTRVAKSGSQSPHKNEGQSHSNNSSANQLISAHKPSNQEVGRAEAGVLGVDQIQMEFEDNEQQLEPQHAPVTPKKERRESKGLKQDQDFYDEVEQLLKKQFGSGDLHLNLQLQSSAHKNRSMISNGKADLEKSLNFEDSHSAAQRIFSVATEQDEEDDDVWALDAQNGFLSHSKMQYVRNMRQVRKKSVQEKEIQRRSNTVTKNSRQLARETTFDSYSLCSTNTGWFWPCCCCFKETHIAGDLGVGVSLYFKQLKNLVVILLLCTLLSMPAYLLFWSGRHLNNPDKQAESQSFDFKTGLASISLANLGEKQSMITELNLSLRQQKVEMFCEAGVIGSINKHGIAWEQDASGTAEYFEDTFCQLDILNSNKLSFITNCEGQQFCEIDWTLPLASTYVTKCLAEYEGSRTITALDFANYALFLQYDCDISTVDLYHFGPMERTQLANICIGCDAVICIIWAINICWLACAFKNEQHEVDKNFVQITDFAIRVKNLPEKGVYDTLDQLKAQLELHIKDVVSKEPQVYRGKEHEDVDPTEIVNIHFAQKNFGKYRILLKIEQLAQQGQKMRTQQRNTQVEKKRLTLEQQIHITKDSIITEANKYMETIKQEDSEAIKNAFVVFRSMEGAARLHQAYTKGKLSLYCTACCCFCCCCDKKTYVRKLFHKKWLKVDEAVEPSLINWENLGLSAKARCLRISILTVISIILLLATTFGIVYAKVQENEISKEKVVCNPDTEITQEMAIADEKLPKDQRLDYQYCYCRSILWEALAKKENPYDQLREPFPDGELHCWDWFSTYTIHNTMIYFVPFAIVFISWVAKTILRVMTSYYGYQSKPEEVYASTANMYYMAFINSGIVIQLVYFKWYPGDEKVPLLLSEYEEFSRDWYEQVGVTIAITLIAMSFSSPLANLGFSILGSAGRCWDRGCTTNSKRTKALTQMEYEDKNTGAEFMFDFRYSSLLVVLSVAFLYSGGLPVMYPVAAAYFFFTYWMDKCLLFKCYRKPIQFDSYLAKHTLGFFKYILMFHIAGFLLMYGMTPILQNDLFEWFVPTEIGLIEQEKFSLFPYYFWLIAFVLVVYLGWVVFVRTCIKLFKRCCARASKFTEQSFTFEQDIYQTITYKQLKHELKATTTEIRKARLMKETGNHNQTYLPEEKLANYIDSLSIRRQSIVHRINEFYAKVFGQKKDKMNGEEQGEIDINAKIKQLDIEDAINPFIDCTMKSEVASYDLLQNEKYGRLDDLKNALEGLHIKQGAQAADQSQASARK